MNKVLTIIVTYNGLKWIDTCISSVRNSTVPSDIFIVDNGSTDGTIDWIFRNTKEDVIFRPSSENLGFGKANNIDLKYALENGYEYVYLLNQDAWIFPDTFEKLISDLEADSSIGIISPMQMTADLSKADSQFAKQTDRIYESKSGVIKVPFVMAAHWMIPTKVIYEIGGFSPAFSHYGEDDNLIHRAAYRGFEWAIDTSAKAVQDRDCRPRPKSYRMMLKKIHAIKMLSDPNKPLSNQATITPLWLIGMGIYHLSPNLVLEAFKILGRYPEIIRRRRESITFKKAFLD
ncbi:MAG: glycosyltransferase [Bacteroidales bacterium]|nr:glycosyltransferase [Bacteroidales bacterium]